MNFYDLEVYVACYDVREEMKANGEKAGSDDWLSEDAVQLTRRVVMKMINEPDSRVISAWKQIRKSPAPDGDDSKVAIAIKLCRVFGPTCFYSGRGLGDCSEDVHVDRIVPGSRDGVYTVANCILSCGRHNMMRGDKSLEEFLWDSK